MTRLGVALDLGTSGFRGQAIDLDRNGKIISTAVTTRHPLPGANVIDHLHFALEVGVDHAHQVIIAALNRVIDRLGADKEHVQRLAVCGNPIQLSLFQSIEIRDLAYAGQRKLESLGVKPPDRDARIVKARDIAGLDLSPGVDVIIPPSVQHEIGADALAMMIQTGILERDRIAVATDYGTNNEMALVVEGIVYTGSTAAGPALEGQHIRDGLLALPGAIADVEFEALAPDAPFSPRRGFHDPRAPKRGVLKTNVLNNEMSQVPGDAVHPETGDVFSEGVQRAVGITGTGVVALIDQGIRAGIIRLPGINTAGEEIFLPDGVRFTREDLLEAGKAIGAVRAGHISLCHEAGIKPQEIEVAFCSGASGAYVDALKAQAVGMIPPNVKRIYQMGNTSLSMAGDLVRDEKALWRMKEIADRLRRHHCMFASSKVFEKLYILELSYWTEGMPFEQYRKFLDIYKLPPLKPVTDTARVIKVVDRDIPDLGEKGLGIIDDIGQRRGIVIKDCPGDMACVRECPENAIELQRREDGSEITIDPALCNGVACRRCERACKDKRFDLIALLTAGERSSDDMISN